MDQVTGNVDGNLRIQSDYAPQVWAEEIALGINRPRAVRTINSATAYPDKHIGNPIVPKQWVALALVGFCVALAALGSWRLLAGELSILGYVAPAAAVATSAGLLVAASYVRRDIPEQVAALQLVQVVEDGTSALVREHAAAYLEGQRDMDLVSNVDGRARAEEVITTGIRRFEITDFQQWKLSNRSWPPAAWHYDTTFRLPTNGLVVDAQLTDAGMRLEVPELVSELEDPLLGYVPGNPMLCSDTADGLLVDGSLRRRRGKMDRGKYHR